MDTAATPDMAVTTMVRLSKRRFRAPVNSSPYTSTSLMTWLFPAPPAPSMNITRGLRCFLLAIPSSTTSMATLSRWHERLGHISTNIIKQMPQYVQNMKITPTDPLTPCSDCMAGRQQTHPFPADSSRQPPAPGQTWSIDFAGPLKHHPQLPNGDKSFFIAVSLAM